MDQPKYKFEQKEKEVKVKELLNLKVYMDGNKHCATLPNFENLQESPAGFGDTPRLAIEGLLYDLIDLNISGMTIEEKCKSKLRV